MLAMISLELATSYCQNCSTLTQDKLTFHINLNFHLVFSRDPFPSHSTTLTNRSNTWCWKHNWTSRYRTKNTTWKIGVLVYRPQFAEEAAYDRHTDGFPFTPLNDRPAYLLAYLVPEFASVYQPHWCSAEFIKGHCPHQSKSFDACIVQLVTSKLPAPDPIWIQLTCEVLPGASTNWGRAKWNDP